MLASPTVRAFHAVISIFLSKHTRSRSHKTRKFSELYTDKQMEKQLRARAAKWFINFVERITPSDRFKEFNYAVLDFTRTICKIKPRCEICPMINYCDYNKTARAFI